MKVIELYINNKGFQQVNEEDQSDQAKYLLKTDYYGMLDESINLSIVKSILKKSNELGSFIKTTYVLFNDTLLRVNFHKNPITRKTGKTSPLNKKVSKTFIVEITIAYRTLDKGAIRRKFDNVKTALKIRIEDTKDTYSFDCILKPPTELEVTYTLTWKLKDFTKALGSDLDEILTYLEMNDDDDGIDDHLGNPTKNYIPKDFYWAPMVDNEPQGDEMVTYSFIDSVLFENQIVVDGANVIPPISLERFIKSCPKSTLVKYLSYTMCNNNITEYLSGDEVFYKSMDDTINKLIILGVIKQKEE